MRMFNRVLGLAALVVATASCGDVVRQGRSPVYLVIELLQGAPGHKPSELSGFVHSDVITNVTEPAPCSATSPCPTIFNDVGQVTLRLSVKDIGPPTTPNTATTNNEITITRLRVVYRRADGRNTPGVDVPHPWDGAATGTVPLSGPLTLSFELVRHNAKEESPLIQLRTSATIITTLADVTFYGRDQVGNAVSVTGTIQVDFGNFGDG